MRSHVYTGLAGPMMGIGVPSPVGFVFCRVAFGKES